jgi:hypothetical protein
MCTKHLLDYWFLRVKIVWSHGNHEIMNGNKIFNQFLRNRGIWFFGVNNTITTVRFDR